MSTLNNCNFSPNSLASTTPRRRPPLAVYFLFLSIFKIFCKFSPQICFLKLADKTRIFQTCGFFFLKIIKIFFQLLKRGTSIAPSPELNSASSSRENAFSFHQNPRTCILFAKNNISVYFGGREQQGFFEF